MHAYHFAIAPEHCVHVATPPSTTGTVVGRTTSILNSGDPIWPVEQNICFEPSNAPNGIVCFDIRDDEPQPLPPLLNFACVPLPLPLGAYTFALDYGCMLSFRSVPPPPPPPPPTPPIPPSPPEPPSPWPPPPPYDLRGKLTPTKCDAMLRDPTHLFRR